MLASLCVMVVSQTSPVLDVSAVKTSATRKKSSGELRPVGQLSRSTDLDEKEQQVLAALSERFRALARKEGLRQFQPDEPGAAPAPGAIRLPGPRGDIAVLRAVSGDQTEWELTTNQIDFARIGPGCCAPCPCTNGVCAPCMACQDRAPCEGVTTGLQVTVRSTVKGKRLVKEVITVETASGSTKLGRGAQLMLEVVTTPGDERLGAFLRSRRPALVHCADKSDGPGVVSLRFRRENNRLEDLKAVTSSLSKLATECVLTVLRGNSVPAGPLTSVELQFSPLAD